MFCCAPTSISLDASRPRTVMGAVVVATTGVNMKSTAPPRGCPCALTTLIRTGMFGIFVLLPTRDFFLTLLPLCLLDQVKDRAPRVRPVVALEAAQVHDRGLA